MEEGLAGSLVAADSGGRRCALLHRDSPNPRPNRPHLGCSFGLMALGGALYVQSQVRACCQGAMRRRLVAARPSPPRCSARVRGHLMGACGCAQVPETKGKTLEQIEAELRAGTKTA